MLTGLLFAIEEAADEPARLVATLPFAGSTVIEYQARQLIAAGVAQIVVIAERPNLELRTALHRIGRRGVTVDTATGAVEAAAVLHPLARLVMLADGLVATDATVAMLAREESEALLVLPLMAAPRGFERIGGGDAWAGVARLDARRLIELAELPKEYAPQSSLLRLVEAAGVARLGLPATVLGEGHAIVDDRAALTDCERRIVAAAIRPRHDWFDRRIAAPLTRVIMPALVSRDIQTGVVAGAAGVTGAGGIALIALDRFGWGLGQLMAAMLAGSVALAMAELRDERRWRRVVRPAMPAVAAAAVLLLGWRCDAVRGGGTAFPIAMALVAATALVERAGAAPARWWGGATSCVLILAAPTLLGRPLLGLVLAAIYVVVMLAMAIEALRPGLARL